MTLVIGGSQHGQIVDWPIKHGGLSIWQIPVLSKDSIVKPYEDPSPTSDDIITMDIYKLERLNLFGIKVEVWVYDKISTHRDSKKFVDLLLPEILSYKGARMFI